MRRNLVWAILGVAALGTVQAQSPTFTVDRLWPKPMGNSWILGSVTGVAVDRQDHIWLVHRGVDSLTTRTEAGLNLDPPGSEACCKAAPHVLRFDPSGALVANWAGRDRDSTGPCRRAASMSTTKAMSGSPRRARPSSCSHRHEAVEHRAAGHLVAVAPAGAAARRRDPRTRMC